MEDKSVLNVEVPETLRRLVKSYAALEGVTVGELVTAALQKAVDELAARRGAGAQ